MAAFPQKSRPATPLEVISTAWHQITSSVSHKIAVLRTEFLGIYAAEYAWALFVFAVLMILLSATFSQLTIPWALLAIGGVAVGVRFPAQSTEPDLADAWWVCTLRYCWSLR